MVSSGGTADVVWTDTRINIIIVLCLITDTQCSVTYQLITDLGDIQVNHSTCNLSYKMQGCRVTHMDRPTHGAAIKHAFTCLQVPTSTSGCAFSGKAMGGFGEARTSTQHKDTT